MSMVRITTTEEQREPRKGPTALPSHLTSIFSLQDSRFTYLNQKRNLIDIVDPIWARETLEDDRTRPQDGLEPFVDLAIAFSDPDYLLCL